ncbi:MAG: hypothetical protein DPW18_04145 [Chloroflexi bacterium]|nr:hypothetical protein [Chloroflexota bacterium]MDL1941208.1 hypothetical protein [Chloroflexi bacterium CFX2]
MRKKLFALVLVSALLSSSWVFVHAQTPESQYFSETGHNVTGEFLKFYNSNPNATFLYGYPITEQITSKDGRTVQYFQRARFEYHADLPEGQRVTLTPLGRETYVSAGMLNVNNTFACRTYVETGFPVCFAFLEFFDKHGGVAQFGYPISGFEYHENKLVQYFEKTRLEWQPWMPEGQRVVVSDLGRVYFDKLGEDPALLTPTSPIGNAPRVITSLQVRAFAWKAVTLASDNQLFFVILQDQNMQPVPDASCTAVVHWTNGIKDSTVIRTNTNGVGIISLSFSNQPYGSLIYTDILCTYLDLSATTTTSFRIWY